LVDVINPFDFPNADRLLEAAMEMLPRLLELKKRCRETGIPSVYVNDHFGRWRSDFSAIVEHFQGSDACGREFVRSLIPDEDDYFVFKPMHSGFYQTTLELLLNHLGARNLILTGLASNICVLATAEDAHMRNYRLWIPPDTTAAGSPEEQAYALLHFERVLQVNQSKLEELNFKKLKDD